MNDYADDEEEPRRLVRVGGPVGEMVVTLRIMGAELDPDEITEILGCAPTEAHCKGDLRAGKKTGKQCILRSGQWSLESPMGKEDLDVHIKWILERLCGDQKAWDAIRTRYHLDLFCGLFLDDWNRGTSISAELLHELGRRGIDLISTSIPSPLDLFAGGTQEGRQEGLLRRHCDLSGESLVCCPGRGSRVLR